MKSKDSKLPFVTAIFGNRFYIKLLRIHLLAMIEIDKKFVHWREVLIQPLLAIHKLKRRLRT